MFKRREKNDYILELWNGHFVSREVIENIKMEKNCRSYCNFKFLYKEKIVTKLKQMQKHFQIK